MGAARKYDSEFMERAVRMYRDRLAGGSDCKWAPVGTSALCWM
jgi:hypothetical protein